MNDEKNIPSEEIKRRREEFRNLLRKRKEEKASKSLDDLIQESNNRQRELEQKNEEYKKLFDKCKNKDDILKVSADCPSGLYDDFVDCFEPDPDKYMQVQIEPTKKCFTTQSLYNYVYSKDFDSKFPKFQGKLSLKEMDKDFFNELHQKALKTGIFDPYEHIKASNDRQLTNIREALASTREDLDTTRDTAIYFASGLSNERINNDLKNWFKVATVGVPALIGFAARACGYPPPANLDYIAGGYIMHGALTELYGPKAMRCIASKLGYEEL